MQGSRDSAAPPQTASLSSFFSASPHVCRRIPPTSKLKLQKPCSASPRPRTPIRRCEVSCILHNQSCKSCRALAICKHRRTKWTSPRRCARRPAATEAATHALSRSTSRRLAALHLRGGRNAMVKEGCASALCDGRQKSRRQFRVAAVLRRLTG